MNNITYLTAGAGSGKTYFLTNTFAEHVENGLCTPSQVIMATFSEKAAADIKRNARIRFLEKKMFTAATELDAANIGTVHSVAFQYIRKYWYLLGISADLKVMDEDEKAAYMALTLGKAAIPGYLKDFRDFAETVNLTKPLSSKIDYDFWRVAVSRIIETADSMGVSDLTESRRESLELIDTAFSAHPHYDRIRKCADHVFDIAQRWRADFAKFKKDNSIIEYNDMENYFLTMLRDDKFEAVREEIKQSIRYVFVDEFQDSNPKQLEIFDLLSELVTHSYWVGDPKQAIYGFRGCDTNLVQALTDNIRGKEKAGKAGFKTDSLDTSRRSLEPLVNFANEIFVKVFPELDRKDVELKPYRKEILPDGTKYIQHWTGVTKEGELKKDGTPKLVLANKGQTITDLASEVRRILDGRGEIRQVYDKETKVLRDIKASDIAVLCRTNTDIGNIAAEFGSYRIPVTVKDTADAGRLEIRLVLLMLNYILDPSQELLNAELAKLQFGLSLSDILSKDYSAIEKLTDTLQEYRDQLSGKGVASVVRGLVIRMNLLDTCARWGNADIRRDNLMALVKEARDYEDECFTVGTSATLEGFISRIQDGGIGVEGYSADGVSIMTYHGSKGLQWPLVIMFSLGNDLLSDTQLRKNFLWDVRFVRKADPTSENMYPGYYIIYVPKFSNAYNPNLTAYPVEKVKMGSPGDPGSYAVYTKDQIKEGRRLLYVVFTRARDIFVEVGQHDNRAVKGCRQLTDALAEFNPKGWESKTQPSWPDGSFQEIWGDKTTKLWYREIDEEDPPADTVTTYSHLAKAAPSTITEAKRISPSSIEDPALVQSVKVKCLDDDGSPFPQKIVKAAQAKDNDLGTCIHNIFAAYDPAAPRAHMVKMAQDTISRHGLSDTLTSPDAIIESAEVLYAFLRKEYGRETSIEHEIPYRVKQNGQMTVGSIDLVWFTSGTECVLVDFKNLPKAGRDVLDPASGDHYIGKYAPQQKAYRDALLQGGYTVRACLLYLAMQEKVAELVF